MAAKRVVVGRHVGSVEAADAMNPSVGAGTPESAPLVVPVVEDGWVGPVATAGVSPKAVGAVLAAVLGTLATQSLVEFPAWANLLVVVALVAVGAVVPGPGVVRRV